MLIAERADAPRGLGEVPATALAVRQRLGRFGLTVAAETGNVRLRGLVDDSLRDELRSRYGSSSVALDGAAGPLAGRLGVVRLDEAGTVLGSRFGAALGGGGATSWFVDAGWTLSPGAWRIGGALRLGWTRLAAGAVRDASTLASRAWSLDVARNGLLVPGDALGLRLSRTAAGDGRRPAAVGL